MIKPAETLSGNLAHDASTNNPPLRISASAPDEIKEYLDKTYAQFKTRFEELRASAAAMPDEVTNDALHGQAGDLIKEIRALAGNLDNARKLENEPFTKAKGTIDSWFKIMGDDLEKWKKTTAARAETYAQKKAEQRRLELEAEAKRQREEAARKAAEAARAEENKRIAEEAAIDAQRALQEARDNQDVYEQGRLDCEAQLAAAKLRKANARRDRDEATFNSASQEVDEWQSKLTAAKADLKNARAAQAQALRNAQEEEKKKRDAEKKHAVSAGDAVAAEGKAAKTEHRVSTTSDADLARSRGEAGSVATMARRWQATIVDLDKVRENIALILPYIDPDVLRVAVNKRMATGNRDVPGVNYEHVASNVTV